MECPRDRQLDRLARAVFLGERDGERDFRGFAGEDDLARGVQVRDIDIGGRCQVAHAVLVAADDRGHGSLSGIAGLLHRSCPFVHEAESGPEIKCFRCAMRGEFAK